MKKKIYMTMDEFGSSIGLSKLDKEVIRQKNLIIDCLKAARRKKRVSQVALARQLGTKQPAIARMEAGYAGEVSFDFLIRVALALGVSLEVIPSKRAA